MTRASTEWPALSGCRLHTTLSCQQGVWGKFQGSSEDFSWIGRSASFNTTAPPIETQLALGAQDDLTQPAAFWRVLNGRCVALAIVPSRVEDRTGRRGLEMHALEWRHDDTPAAVGALTLLPAVWKSALTSTLALTGAPLAAAAQSNAAPLSDHVVDVQRSRLQQAAANGVESLLSAVSRDSLVGFYSALLGGQRPAMLTAGQPLSAEALAALLLPLDRDHADAVSLAGWIVSTALYERMPSMWNGIVWARVPQEFRGPSAPGHLSAAERLVDSLDGLSRTSGGTSQPPPVATSSYAEYLARFVESAERWRQLNPPSRQTTISAADRIRLDVAVAALQRQVDGPPRLPPRLRDARLQQLQAKLDLVREIVQQLDPAVGDDWWLE